MKIVYNIVFVLFCYSSFANISLPAVFGDYMVLQQKSSVNIWGAAKPGEQVVITVTWNETRYTTTASSSGEWKIKLKTSNGSYKEQTIKIQGLNLIVFKHVLLGEVWFSSGQSNMEWVMRRVSGAKKELDESNYPNIRLFNVNKKVADEEQRQLPENSKWLSCDSINVKEFSAISYYFARELHLKLDVPIGIMTASWGGTGAECWTPEENIRTNSALDDLYVRWKKWDIEREKDSVIYHEALARGIKKEEPQSVYMTNRPHRRPSVLFNAMVAPLIPYTIKGVVWYQGTSNRSWANEYLEQMKSLIIGWRSNWGIGEFPFYYLQIAPFKYSDSNLASIIRENQLKTLEVTNTAMSTTMDIGDLNDIHIPNKFPYGLRLANIALANTYSKRMIDFCGPLYANYKINGEKIEVDFQYDSKLYFKGGDLTDIYISGDDKKFIKAKAYIDDNKLIVYSSEVKQPVAVRYAWNNTDKANLFNGSNLPASPFRTDNWENIIIE